MRASDQVQSAEDSSIHTADTCSGKQQASEHLLLQQYKQVKQQIAARKYTDALAQGWQLLQQIHSAVKGSSSSSRCLQELLVAASLNVAICTAEAGTPDTSTLQRLNEALSSLVPILRDPSTPSAAQHAGVLYKCLLKVTLVVGQAAAVCDDPSADLQEALQELLLWLLAAAQLSGRTELPMQVAVKACQQLPESLQHCMLEALVTAAQLQPTSSRAATETGRYTSRKDQSQRVALQRASASAVSTAHAAACLQRVVAHVQLSSSSIAKLLKSMLSNQPGCADALPHSTLYLVMIALCSRCEGALSANTAATLASTSLSCSQHLEQQAQCLRDEAQGAAGRAAGKQSSKQARGRTSSSIPANGSAVEDEVQLAWLQLQVCAIQQVLAAGQANSLQLLTPLAVSVAANQVSAWCAAGQQQTSTMAEGAASLLANTADCLAQCWLLRQQHAAACQDGAACSHKFRKTASQQHSDSAFSSCQGSESCCLQQLQQLTAAVAHLVSWHNLRVASVRPVPAEAAACEGRVTASALTALAQRLQAAALSVSSALTAVAAPAAGAPTSSQGTVMAAGLWLQAAMCRCAAAVSVLTSSISDMGTVDTADHSAAAIAAVTHVLQAAKAYFGMAYKQVKAHSCTEASSAAKSANPDAAAHQHSASTPSGLQEHPQRVMQVVARIALQLPEGQQQALRQQLQSTIRGYCRLRCAAATANVRTGSAAAAGSQKAARGSSLQQSERARKPARQGVSQQHGLCSALQLAAESTGEGCAGAGDWQRLPLDRLCWLEGAALAQVAGAAATTESAAAALQLLEDLSHDIAALCSDRGGRLLEAHGCMASGMLLLVLAQTGCQAVSANSRMRWQTDAEGMLTRACQGFGSLLKASGLVAEQSSPESITAHMAGLSLADGRKAQQQRQGSKRKGKAAASAATAAEALVAAGQGAQGATAVAPEVTACAALCHCLLGLTMARTAMCTGADSDTTAAECEEDSMATDASSSTHAPAPVGRGSRTNGRSAAKTKGAGHSTSEADNRSEGRMAALTSAKQHMQDSIRLFRAFSAAQATAGQRAGSAAGCDYQAANSLWYAEEAAMAVAQAWHISAFQDWYECQQGSAEVLESIATQQVQEELGFLQLLPAVRSCSTPKQTWLSLLLQQQALPSSAASEAGSSGSTGNASSRARRKCSDTETILVAQQPPGCKCASQEYCRTLQALAAECLQHQQQDDAAPTGWEVLQQVQLQHAAADAAAQAGDHASAAAAAEVALRQSRAVLSTTTSSAQSRSTAESGAGGSSTARGGSAGHVLAANLAAAGNACMQSQALGLYMSGLWQLSETLEAAGNPQDAVRMLKQLYSLAQSAGCHSFAVLAQARLGTLYSRMEQPDKASAAAASAQQLHQMLQEASAAAAEPSSPSCASILTAAAVASAQGAVLLAGQQVEVAQQHFQIGLSALSAHADSAGGMWQLGWRCMEQYTQLVLQLSQCHVLLGNKQQAVAELQAAVGVLTRQGQPTCQRCNCGPWPAVLAAVQLELLTLTQPTWSATCASSGSSFAIAGFHSGSHNNALFAEFEHAAEDADQTDSTNLPTQGSSAGSGTGAKRSSRGATAAASGPRQARAAKARQPKGGKGKAGCADSSQDLDSSGQAATAAVDQSAWVCSVMQAAAASCQQPLLLRQACRLLCDAFMAAGAVQAALMYHHISLGASTTQRQLMQATSQPNCEKQGAAASSSQEPLQQLLSYAEVLQQAANAAAGSYGDGSGDPAAALHALGHAVDEVASAWLINMLQRLPQGTAVCTISRQAGSIAGQADGLLVSRAALDAVHSSLGSSLLVCLPIPPTDSRAEDAGLSAVLQSHQDILTDAAASMSAASSLRTSAEKCGWWKQRLDQDQRMAQLVQQLDSEWLGPWRCLIMQPQQPAAAAAASAAAQAVVAEHFCVLDDKPRELLSQMMALLVAHAGACTPSELATAAQHLSTLTQQRMDGLHLDRLLSDLQTAHAEVMKLQKVQQATAPAPAAVATAAGKPPATPCAGKARRLAADAGVATTAGKPSRLSALAGVQSGSAQSESKQGKACGNRTLDSDAGVNSSTMAAPFTAAVEVPQSIARHTQRRSRLKPLSSSAAGDSRTSRLQAAPEGSAVPQFDDPAAASSTSSLFSAALDASATTPAPARKTAGRLARCSDAAPASSMVLAVDAADSKPSSWQPAVIVVLDSNTQQLPWESCSGLQHQHLYRCPGLAFATALAVKLRSAPASLGRPLQLSHSFYLLNPDGDLCETQQTFEEQLRQLCREGYAGAPPAASQLASALQQYDLFLYFGHGAAQQYLPLSALRGLDRCAACLLMGCSSGKLRPAGVYEPHGPVWDYLMAGAPTIIANLWDVTDRDIDRFAAQLLQNWCGLKDTSHLAGNGGPADGMWSTAAAAGGDSSRQGSMAEVLVSPGTSVSLSVSLGRRACRLQSLVGNAVACWGLPTFL